MTKQSARGAKRILSECVIAKQQWLATWAMDQRRGVSAWAEATMQYSQAVSVGETEKARGSVQETSDESLVLAIASGDKQALQVLFARHNVRVYRFVLRFLNDET